ncbi:MAG: transcriptional repressor LexA [Candidatus Marinimicrobia bacterium]|nr:transcriptional repressor LexA [Candidatus Neomarinimicrobiota bacterium]
MTGLSPKKQKFFNFVADFIETNDRSPTYKEIMEGLNFSSPGTIDWYVKELEKAGVLERAKQPNGKRALRLAPQYQQETLPLLGRIAAGNPIEAVENREEIEVPTSYIREENYVLEVKGDSMIEDNIQDGDFVIIRQQDTANQGETVVALVNNEATLKRYHPRPDHIELRPANADYKPIIVSPDDDFRIRGVVLYVFRSYARE